MNVNYPSVRAVKLIREEAKDGLDLYAEEETPAPILLAMAGAVDYAEAAYLGAAYLARREALADAGYRFGEEYYPARLTEIAGALGWNP